MYLLLSLHCWNIISSAALIFPLLCFLLLQNEDVIILLLHVLQKVGILISTPLNFLFNYLIILALCNNNKFWWAEQHLTSTLWARYLTEAVKGLHNKQNFLFQSRNA